MVSTIFSVSIYSHIHGVIYFPGIRAMPLVKAILVLNKQNIYPNKSYQETIVQRGNAIM